MWQRACIFPDPETGWAWASRSLLGLPNLVRVLVTLYRAGIREVVLPSSSEALRSWLHAERQQRGDIPALIWSEQKTDTLPATPVLGVRGGILFTSSFLSWFCEAIGKVGVGKAVLTTPDAMPVLVSWMPMEVNRAVSEPLRFEEIDSRLDDPGLSVPQHVFCQPVRVLEQPGGDRKFLASVGKPTDRWHVEWVRGWTFPAIRGLASTRVTPNHISCVGFLVALTACWLVAQGRYWPSIVGALLLYASWVLDCMDGTMARLTYAESTFGQKLDTTLGYLSNLAIFSALVWAVYGHQSLWKAAGVAFFLLGGILIAHRLVEKEKASRGQRPAAPSKLHRFLDQLNHRDYAVVILLLALLDGLHVFLWLSLVGVQVYWLTLLMLMRKHQGRI